MFDSIVIGAGAAGAVAARELAEKQNKQVLILEKRDHIAGNCYDEKDPYGILIHRYGPHIFHTAKKNIYEYLSRFTKWYDYSHEVVAKVNGQFIPVPFNLNTLHMVYEKEKADKLEEKLIRFYGMEKRVSILELRQNEDPEIHEVADFVYENIFLKYTMKQWGQTPDEIDPLVVNRVPVLISYDNRYFQDPWQGMPLEGYTVLFENILNHPNIKYELGQDALDRLHIQGSEIFFDDVKFNGDVIYTGPADELFDCCYGRLPYRSLDFVFEHWQKDYMQPKGVVNYTVDEDYTRITEFKYLTGQVIADSTTTVKEYSKMFSGAEGEIPYYSIINAENRALYEKYAEKAGKVPNLHLLGRLAEYQYYNIDAMVEKALKLAENIHAQEVTA